MKLAIGPLEGSCLSLAATANIPSLLGMLVYSDETSKVHSIAPSGIEPKDLIFLIKCVSYVGFSLRDIFFDMFIH